VRAAGPYRRVLAGFDGSPDSAEALRAAVAIAACDGGHVVALSAVRYPTHADGDQDQDSEGRSLREMAEEVFGELRASLPPGSTVRMSAQVLYCDPGSPGQAVTGYAAEHGFDVLVLGRHGAGRRRKSRLGQVASLAAGACPVPVLLASAP
jgi:nucleotide-binding universal stress UspA family protein